MVHFPAPVHLNAMVWGIETNLRRQGKHVIRGSLKLACGLFLLLMLDSRNSVLILASKCIGEINAARTELSRSENDLLHQTSPWLA